MILYRAIVIGCSAGGLQALTQLLCMLDGEYPIPILVVQHRSKDQKSLLEEVLQSKTRIRVKQADEKEKIVEGTVYIAPPDYHMLVEDDYTISLSNDAPVKYSRPSIDVLFESAALVYKSSLVGIILTGASNDGTEGISRIRQNGGLTISQEPSEAAYKIMPCSAIETGDVKYIWDVKRISKFLIDFKKSWARN